MMPAPAQLRLPGFPEAPQPSEEETKLVLLPIEVNDRGAHLKVIAMWRGTYANVAAACQAASAMGLVA